MKGRERGRSDGERGPSSMSRRSEEDQTAREGRAA